MPPSGPPPWRTLRLEPTRLALEGEESFGRSVVIAPAGSDGRAAVALTAASVTGLLRRRGVHFARNAESIARPNRLEDSTEVGGELLTHRHTDVRSVSHRP